PSGPDGSREVKQRIAPVAVLRGAREDAQVELLAECVPFARERGVERQAVARPPDEQDTRLHAAISSSLRSSSPNTRSGAYSATDDAAPARRRSRSSASAKYRRTASPSARVSPGGTSKPLTPSRTTSPTPPASIASTGVPAASASTTVCGKFSHVEDRIVASAARKSSTTRSPRCAPRKRRRSSRPSSATR